MKYMGAYINLRYSAKNNIIIDYFLSDRYSPNMRQIGIILKKNNLENVKKTLGEIIQNSGERIIIISSKKNSLSGEYSKLSKEKLKKVKESLEKQRSDITFKLEI